MKQSITIRHTTDSMAKALRGDELRNKPADLLCERDFTEWIDLRLGAPSTDTAFGLAYHEMASKNLSIYEHPIYALCSDDLLHELCSPTNLVCKADKLNKAVGLWWGNTKTFIKTFMRV